MKERYHFLDGLRGGAMLLGLVLHGILSFSGEPWLAMDVGSEPEVILPIIGWIHGFRMQLFFLVSGFFTAMMWKKRGGTALVKQRLLRIGIPLVAGAVILFPTMMVLAAWGGEVIAERTEMRAEESKAKPKEKKADQNAERKSDQGLQRLVLSGNYTLVKVALNRGGDVNAKDDSGTPLLTLATLADDWAMIDLLLERGADIEGRGADGGTALMSASFWGREQAAQALLRAGAEVDAKNKKGETAIYLANLDFEHVEYIGKRIGVEVTEKNRAARERIVKALEDGGAKGDPWGWYKFLAFVPILHHLWFLHYLLWLLAIFLPFALVARNFKGRLPDFLIGVPGCLVWLIPLTWWFQTLMPGEFGPTTAVGFVPWPPLLGYYAIFFFFGAMCFGRGIWEEKVGRYWPLWLLFSLVLGLYGMVLLEGGGDAVPWLASGFAWTTIIAMMGFFRAFLNQGNPKVRYLSDSAYWLYLAHLPVMIMVQILISGWEIPLIIKLVIVIGGVTAVLLVIYEFAIRYTWIGAILNGRKFRVSPPPLPIEKQEV
ncbi:MAG: acyltransferase family protein [Verrucomicrobia bacterium]|nr:acyltransferase family protein [Verrucomicrobiota bacterium]